MWTEEQAKDLDRRFEKHKNELKAEVDLLRQETNAKFDIVFSVLNEIKSHLGIK